MNLYKISKRLVFVCVLGLSFLVLPAAWSGVHLEMDPVKVATAEVRMWRVYYAKDYVAFRQELENFLRSQFNISDTDANYIGEPLTSAIVKFEAIESNYESVVFPYIELAYSRLKQKLGIRFDPKEVAEAELDWWVARRTLGEDSVDDVGRLITRLYVLLFGEDKPEFGRAGLFRAQAAHLRDKGGKLCNWDVVEKLLHKSYQALKEGLEPASNSHSAQVALGWDPNKEVGVAGYKIYYGDSSGEYGSSVDVGNRRNYTITGLESGNTYYFVITAYNFFGSESKHSEEIVQEAIVGPEPQMLPRKSSGEKRFQFSKDEERSGREWGEDTGAHETVVEKTRDTEFQAFSTSHSSSEIVWLSQEINLNKRYKGPFSVKIRIEGVEKLGTSSFFLRLKYYIGTGSSLGYFDMVNEGDGVWGFDIPDPGWYKYRSKYLHYQVKMFSKDGSVILESSTKAEFIDSFIRDYN